MARMESAGTIVGGEARAERRPLFYRHRLPTRLWHWGNALVVLMMLMSGLMIFNAHPRLYWGSYGANSDHAWLAIGATQTQGLMRIGPLTVPTTGVLGRWSDKSGTVRTTAFPGWATIPSHYDLAAGRRWHLSFAWLLVAGWLFYAVAGLLNRHIRSDLAPRRGEFAPRALWRDAAAHAHLRFPRGEAARRYGSLQKLAYLTLLFGLLPVMVLTGFTMSPAIDAAWPWLLDLFGGRQSARSIHFITAFLIVGFVVIHLAMVLLSGPLNQIRGMVTGRYRLPRGDGEAGA
jgi:thiosulfate reductase cytochrome b subunit